MTANQQDSVAVLRDNWQAKARGLLARLETMQPPNVLLQQITMLGEARDILRDALQSQQVASADRGEAVLHRWLRDGEPQGSWVVGHPSPRQFDAADECRKVAHWTVEYAIAATPPSPAAPSGVSDAMVDSAARALCQRFAAECGGDAPDAWAKLSQHFKDDARAALEASQPQPGRVEGNSYAGVHIWIGDKQVRQFITELDITHEHESGNAITSACQTALNMIAAPTAGGVS